MTNTEADEAAVGEKPLDALTQEARQSRLSCVAPNPLGVRLWPGLRVMLNQGGVIVMTLAACDATGAIVSNSTLLENALFPV